VPVQDRPAAAGLLCGPGIARPATAITGERGVSGYANRPRRERELPRWGYVTHCYIVSAGVTQRFVGPCRGSCVPAATVAHRDLIECRAAPLRGGPSDASVAMSRIKPDDRALPCGPARGFCDACPSRTPSPPSTTDGP